MRSYQVTNNNNFCRVFRIPNEYPTGFCFGGAKPVIFHMEEWFNPVSNIADTLGVLNTNEIETLHETLKDFIMTKPYYNKDNKYLIICDFGLSLII